VNAPRRELPRPFRDRFAEHFVLPRRSGLEHPAETRWRYVEVIKAFCFEYRMPDSTEWRELLFVSDLVAKRLYPGVVELVAESAVDRFTDAEWPEWERTVAVR